MKNVEHFATERSFAWLAVASDSNCRSTIEISFNVIYIYAFKPQQMDH